jgi:hypothetical protein
VLCAVLFDSPLTPKTREGDHKCQPQSSDGGTMTTVDDLPVDIPGPVDATHVYEWIPTPDGSGYGRAPRDTAPGR